MNDEQLNKILYYIVSLNKNYYDFEFMNVSFSYNGKKCYYCSSVRPSVQSMFIMNPSISDDMKIYVFFNYIFGLLKMAWVGNREIFMENYNQSDTKSYNKDFYDNFYEFLKDSENEMYLGKRLNSLFGNNYHISNLYLDFIFCVKITDIDKYKNRFSSSNKNMEDGKIVNKSQSKPNLNMLAMNLLYFLYQTNNMPIEIYNMVDKMLCCCLKYKKKSIESGVDYNINMDFCFPYICKFIIESDKYRCSDELIDLCIQYSNNELAISIAETEKEKRNAEVVDTILRKARNLKNNQPESEE